MFISSISNVRRRAHRKSRDPALSRIAVNGWKGYCLVARYIRVVEVSGTNPLCSTFKIP